MKHLSAVLVVLAELALKAIVPCTVNQEIFVVKIFSDSMASAQIKCTKIMRIINDNAVQGRLPENYLTRKFIA